MQNFLTVLDNHMQKKADDHDAINAYPVFEGVIAERHDGTLVALQLRRQVHLVCV